VRLPASRRHPWLQPFCCRHCLQSRKSRRSSAATCAPTVSARARQSRRRFQCYTSLTVTTPPRMVQAVPRCPALPMKTRGCHGCRIAQGSPVRAPGRRRELQISSRPKVFSRKSRVASTAAVRSLGVVIALPPLKFQILVTAFVDRGHAGAGRVCIAEEGGATPLRQRGAELVQLVPTAHLHFEQGAANRSFSCRSAAAHPTPHPSATSRSNLRPRLRCALQRYAFVKPTFCSESVVYDRFAAMGRRRSKRIGKLEVSPMRLDRRLRSPKDSSPESSRGIAGVLLTESLVRRTLTARKLPIQFPRCDRARPAEISPEE
jgi:hypothetical protein